MISFYRKILNHFKVHIFSYNQWYIYEYIHTHLYICNVYFFNGIIRLAKKARLRLSVKQVWFIVLI